MASLVDRTLFGPGPSNPYPEATSALGQPLLGHLDPAFLEVMDETCDRLRQVWGTANTRTLPLSATGSAGMEASFVNTVAEGDVVVVAVNGLFGQRMCDVAARCGAEVVAVDHEWGTPVDADRRAVRPPAARRSSPPCTPRPPPASAPTSRRSAPARGTRCCSPTRSPRSAASSCAPTTGASTSATPAPRSASGWHPGSRRSRSTTAPSRVGSRSRRSWYLDLGLLGGYVGEASGSGGRTYHHTAPTAMVVSLHAGLGRILDEGLENVWARHAEAGGLLHEGLVDMGLELFAQEGSRLPELTTVKVPDGVDSAAVRALLLERHGIEIGAGAGPYAATVWRIGLMGHNARPDAALLALSALRDVLTRVGWTG